VRGHPHPFGENVGGKAAILAPDPDRALARENTPEEPGRQAGPRVFRAQAPHLGRERFLLGGVGFITCRVHEHQSIRTERGFHFTPETMPGLMTGFGARDLIQHRPCGPWTPARA
jgi:hypothetical protein